VDIAFGRDAEGAWLAVDDSGPGIPPQEQQRVFDRFYRLPGSEAAGSGLGLAIVKTVAERLGAQVRLARSPSLGGLRVEVRLPP
jgi:two-component system OmpR family sensor kinase